MLRCADIQAVLAVQGFDIGVVARFRGVFLSALGLFGRIEFPAAHVPGFAGGGRGLEHDGTGLRRQACLDDQGAVGVVVELHAAFLVQRVRPFTLGDALHLAVVGCVDVGGELGYLVFRGFQRGGATLSVRSSLSHDK